MKLFSKIILRFLGILLVTSFLLGKESLSHAVVITNFTQVSMEAALTNGGLITFSTNGTIAVTNALKILTNTTINGEGLSIIFSGSNTSRVFYVSNNVTFTLANVTVTRGDNTNGAGLFISTNATVNLTNCIFSLNDAIGANGINGRNGVDSGDDGGSGGAGVPGIGGAIYNLGALSIANSTISNNVAFGGDGGNAGNGANDSLFGGNGGNGGRGALGWGGGIYNAGSVFIINSTIRDNFASGGNGKNGGSGGLAPFPGTSGSGGIGGSGLGGGLYNLGSATITNSIFVTNGVGGGDTGHAGPDDNGSGGGAGNGGAIYNIGTFSIGNSTFTRNASRGGKGGDVFTGESLSAGDGGSGSGGAIFHNSATTNQILSCTFATNSATGGPGGVSAFSANNGSVGASLGGNINRISGQVLLRNTILAKGASGPNCSGTITDGGNNLSSDATPSNFPTAAKNKDAKLASLANNGGPTLTMALNLGSPAIDKGNPAFCPAADQRGILRPQGTNCDIGAYELIPSFSISGKISEGTNGIPGITISAGNQSAISQSNGTFSIFGLLTSNYVVTPTQIGSGLSPISTNVFVGTNLANPITGISVTGVNFFANPVAISPPTLGFATTTNQNPTNMIVSFQFTAMPQRTYRVQASSNLNSTNWVNVSTNLSSSNGSFEFAFPLTKTNRTKFPQRFFRTVIP